MDSATAKSAMGSKARALARFEVRGLDADRALIRALIRALARRLADEGPEAARLREAVSDAVEGEPAKPKLGGILAALRASPLVGSGIDLTKTRHPGRDIDL